METENVPHLKHLVILAPNWLGDSVMSLPAIADVRRALPKTRVTIAARPSIAPFFALIADVNDVVSPEDLSGRSFDGALLLPNSFRSALLVWKARIPERWGYNTALRGPLLTRRVRRPSGVHQAASYQNLVRSLGFPNGPSEPRVDLADAARRAGASALRAAGWDGVQPLVAFAPGAAYGGAKRWPAASFAGVAMALSRDGIGVVLVGSAADAPVGAELQQTLDPSSRVLNLMGTDLKPLAGTLAHVRVLVTNDSGAMHLGAALGTGIVAMFGPTNERETRPLTQNVDVLTHAVWCRPCKLRECPIDHRCMRGITVDAVLAATRSKI
jgi:heptosyltransferase-2